VVPRVEEGESKSCPHAPAASDAAAGEGAVSAVEVETFVREMLRQRTVPHAPGQRRQGQRRYSWAELLRRVHLIDVLLCPHCGSRRRLLAAIHDTRGFGE